MNEKCVYFETGFTKLSQNHWPIENSFFLCAKNPESLQYIYFKIKTKNVYFSQANKIDFLQKQ